MAKKKAEPEKISTQVYKVFLVNILLVVFAALPLAFGILTSNSCSGDEMNCGFERLGNILIIGFVSIVSLLTTGITSLIVFLGGLIRTMKTLDKKKLNRHSSPLKKIILIFSVLFLLFAFLWYVPFTHWRYSLNFRSDSSRDPRPKVACMYRLMNWDRCKFAVKP